MSLLFPASPHNPQEALACPHFLSFLEPVGNRLRASTHYEDRCAKGTATSPFFFQGNQTPRTS